MKNNDIFHLDDPHNYRFKGYQLPVGWWSRHYEYQWAYQWASSGETVADMGYGWTFRPLKNALTKISERVYGIDAKPSQEPSLPDNFIMMVEDFTHQTTLPDNSMDKIFCISVLEDLLSIERALVEFKRVLTPGGLIVLTFDVPYAEHLPQHHLYKGVNFTEFRGHVENAGLAFVGPVFEDRNKALFNEEFNLCVYHALLEIA